MNLVIQSPDVYMLPIRTPTYPRHWTPHLPHCYALLSTLPLPYSHRPIVRARHDEFNPGTTCHRPVEGVDDPTVRRNFFDALTGGDVCED